MVRNLLSNAERHAVSCIAVTLRAEGTDAVLTVDDDGAGTVPQDRERVFERFVPLDDCRARDTGGSGPGLAITRGPSPPTRDRSAPSRARRTAAVSSSGLPVTG